MWSVNQTGETVHIIVNTALCKPADKLLKTSRRLDKRLKYTSVNRLVLNLKFKALVLKPMEPTAALVVKSREENCQPCLKSPYAFIEIIITNIAFDSINFPVWCSVEPYQLNVAFFFSNPTLQVPLRNKAGMETGAGNWKERSRCVVETAVLFLPNTPVWHTHQMYVCPV